MKAFLKKKAFFWFKKSKFEPEIKCQKKLYVLAPFG